MSNSVTLKKIKNEISGTVFSLPYYVARDQGYFADEGIDIEFVKRNSSDRIPDIKLIEDHHQVNSFLLAANHYSSREKLPSTVLVSGDRCDAPMTVLVVVRS
ncbi:ABC transporter substrate-binding protein [Komarekiella delphini-convector]|uniref:ABC transporter substrate-binding protein n=1 Tax=Komarekiella delphini-convector TaxID=3050158 RepID=UPI001CD8B10B|nr:ABC transporter substrate-binding protein [Komarekiella delphini-convector]